MALFYDAPSTDFEDPAMISRSTYQPINRGVGGADIAVFEYTFVQNRADWTTTALNTEDPRQSLFYLFEETMPADAGAGLITWQMKFGYVPSSPVYSYGYEAVTFPGFYDSYDTNTAFRPPYTLVVPVQRKHEFMKTADPQTDFPMYHYEQKELYMNARGEYVDYVDDETTVEPVGGSRTYSEYIALMASESAICIREPISRRAFGAGYIWEKVTFFTIAE